MKGVAATLAEYAARYETAKFLEGDPSWFMHQVDGRANQEATAFVASALSFGSRRQFMPTSSSSPQGTLPSRVKIFQHALSLPQSLRMMVVAKRNDALE